MRRTETDAFVLVTCPCHIRAVAVAGRPLDVAELSCTTARSTTRAAAPTSRWR